MPAGTAPAFASRRWLPAGGGADVKLGLLTLTPQNKTALKNAVVTPMVKWLKLLQPPELCTLMDQQFNPALVGFKIFQARPCALRAHATGLRPEPLLIAAITSGGCCRSTPGSTPAPACTPTCPTRALAPLES